MSVSAPVISFDNLRKSYGSLEVLKGNYCLNLQKKMLYL